MSAETLDRMYLEYAHLTNARNFRELKMESALRSARAAINPSDKSGINLDTWNKRLKDATVEIDAALSTFNEPKP